MKTVAFILITLVSGAIAGTMLGLINQILVEPYIDQAIAIEVQNTVASGESVDVDELVTVSLMAERWGDCCGNNFGYLNICLFGIVYIYSRDSLPGSNNKKKGLILAGIMSFVIFSIPALKYPANPPALGDPETIEFRESLYIGILVISGLAGLGVAILYRSLGQTRRESRKSLCQQFML